MDISKYVNPYAFVSQQYKNGLDAVAADLAPLYPNQTLDDLVNSVYNYVESIYFSGPPNALIIQTLKSNIYAIINGYLNAQSGEYLLLGVAQMNFAFQLLEGTTDCKNPEDIRQHILNVEDNITKSSLTTTQQMPLLYATEIGKASYDYWAAVISHVPPPVNNWHNFITSFTPTINKFPFWVAAAMEGAMIALSMYAQRDEKQTEMQLLLNLTGNVGGTIVQALFGALGVGAGKVVFKLEQRPIEISCAELMNKGCACK